MIKTKLSIPPLIMRDCWPLFILSPWPCQGMVIKLTAELLKEAQPQTQHTEIDLGDAQRAEAW